MSWIPVCVPDPRVSQICSCPGSVSVSQRGVGARLGLQDRDGIQSSALGSQIPRHFVPASSVSEVMAPVPPRAHSLLQPQELLGPGQG